MAWFLGLLAYGSLVAASVLIHLLCIVTVPIGFCEVKYRALRLPWNRKKHGIMTHGINFVWPFIQWRYRATTNPGSVFPTMKTAGPQCETGMVFVQSKTGEPLLVEAVFTFFIDDVQAFVDNEFDPDLSPHDMARHRARERVVAVVERMRTHSEPEMVASIMRGLARQPDDNDDDNSAIRVSFFYIKRCAITKDLPVITPIEKDE